MYCLSCCITNWQDEIVSMRHYIVSKFVLLKTLAFTKKSESTLGAILMDECLQLSFVMLQCFHFPCGSLCKFVSKLVL